MKNQNCLKGVMCPKCGNTERFALLVSLWVIVEDEGTDENINQAIEWDESTLTACKKCDHRDPLGKMQHPGFYVTFDVVTEESAEHGDSESRGWWEPGGYEYEVHDKPEQPAYSFDPDDFDEEEHDTFEDAIVEWAVGVLRSNGACHPNQSPSDHAEWWSTEDEENYETGAKIGKQFHLVGVRDEVAREVNKCVIQ